MLANHASVDFQKCKYVDGNYIPEETENSRKRIIFYVNTSYDLLSVKIGSRFFFFLMHTSYNILSYKVYTYIYTYIYNI